MLDAGATGARDPWRVAATDDGRAVCVIDGDQTVRMLSALSGVELWRSESAAVLDVSCPDDKAASVVLAPFDVSLERGQPQIAELGAVGLEWERELGPNWFSSLRLQERVVPWAIAASRDTDTAVVLDIGGPRLVALSGAAGQQIADNAVVRPSTTKDPLDDLPFDWTADVATLTSGHQGDVAVLNNDQRLVGLLSLLRGTPRGARNLRWWAVPEGARRVAASPNGDVFVLFEDGAIRRYDGAGALQEVWWASGADDARQSYADISAAGASGEIVVVDALRDRLLFYGPGGAAHASEPASRCQVRTSKDAAPRSVWQTQSVSVSLEVSGECPTASDKTDVVLVLDALGTAADVAQRTADARALLDQLDMSRDRAAIVTITSTVQVASGLSSDRSALRAQLQAVMAAPIMKPGETPFALAAGLHAAADLLPPAAAGTGRRALIVVWGWFDCCRTWPSTEGVRLARRGIHLGVVDVSQRTSPEVRGGIGGLLDINVRLLATSPELVWHGFRGVEAWRAFVDGWSVHRMPAELLSSGIVTDELPVNMEYVESSAMPAAAWDPGSRTLSWSVTHVPLTGFRVTYQTQPLEPGTWPTNVEARLRYVDAFGATGEKPFPVPTINVRAPTVSPTAVTTTTPTPLAVAPTPAPSSTSTSAPRVEALSMYLPLVLRERCPTDRRHVDVVLVIDASTSMHSEHTAAGRTRLEAALEAARAFVAELVMPPDQAAVVGFNSDAWVEVALTHRRTDVDAGLSRIAAGVRTQTRLDLGICSAHRELTGPRRIDTNQPAMIVLTDGRANPEPASTAVRRAADAKAAGITVFTIGLGQVGDVDVNELQEMASKPAYFYRTPDEEDLVAIYRAIAVEIPCPSVRYWGRR